MANVINEPGDDGGSYGGGSTANTAYPPVVTSTSLPTGSIGTAYSQQLTATYGTGSYTWSLTAGALPAGLSLSAAGLISGKPTAAGTSYFVAQATDTAGSTGSANLSIAIPTQPSIVTTSLPAGTSGVPYQGSLSGSGGAAPYTFAVVAGSLPIGVTLASTGGLTGTPTTPGTYTFAVSITDSASPKGTNTATFSIGVARASLAASVRSLDDMILLGCQDGALYAIVPGQKHDQDYTGASVAFTQQWFGVPTSTSKLALMKVGGVTVSAKGSGVLNVTLTSDEGATYTIGDEKRQMVLSTTETTRDFLVKAVPSSTRFAPCLSNGGVLDAWFEAHVLQIWMRQNSPQRKA